MRHAFDAVPDARPDLPPCLPQPQGGSRGSRVMCLLATILLSPHVWVLATLANFDAGRQAIAFARGRQQETPDLPYPLVGSIAGVTLACYAALALPGLTAGELLTSPATWAILLIPEWAWLAPAAIARLPWRASPTGRGATAGSRYHAAGAFSAR